MKGGLKCECLKSNVFHKINTFFFYYSIFMYYRRDKAHTVINVTLYLLLKFQFFKKKQKR